MLMRLSVTTQLHDVVAFIGSLQGFETRSHGARLLRNHLSVSSGLAFVPCRVDLIHVVNLSFSSNQRNHTHDTNVPLFVIMRSASLLRVIGCHCGMLHVLALGIVGFAKKMDLFLPSQMGWPKDVCSIDAFRPYVLCRF